MSYTVIQFELEEANAQHMYMYFQESQKRV